ncbi:MAG: cell wall hydrolase [Christensenellales bacterium]|jgi:spore germination cell wall hydrolase CwlJ-like protein
MEEQPGHSILNAIKNLINRRRNPVKTQRVAFAHAIKYKGNALKDKTQYQRSKIKLSNKNYNILEQQKRSTAIKPLGKKNGIAFLFTNKKKGSNRDALEFAESNRRLGKKGRRNRRIVLYAGTSFFVIIVLLAVVLVPGGAAAQPDSAQDVSAMDQNAATQTALAAALLEEKQIFNEALEVGTTKVTPSAIPTTSTDDIKAFATDPTAKPTVTPTAKPTIEPTAGPTVGPTAKPIIEPTAKPKADPTPKPTPIPTTKPDPTQNPINIDEWVDYYMVEADLYYNDARYSPNHYNYTDDEFYMLAQIIQSEAGGELYKGKIAVGNVVMNRVLCRSYPGNSITAVVTAPNQFAYNSNTKPSSSAKSAARDVLDFEVWVIPQNIYFFRATSSTSNWGSHSYAMSIGGHSFYSESYSGRYKGDAVPPALFKRTYKWPQFGCNTGKRVYRVQYMLNKLGYDVYADSYFGEGTKVALMAFQQSKGLKADGVAGPSTLKALITAFGPNEYYLKFCV